MGAIDEGRTVRLTIPAKPEYITLSRLALSGLSRVRPLAEETLADLKLALTEACSNSVRHAYDEEGGHVSISFELRDDRLIVEVVDDGTGFEPDGAGKNGDGQTRKIPFNYNRVVKDNRGEGNVTLKSGDVVVVP